MIIWEIYIYIPDAKSEKCLSDIKDFYLVLEINDYE